MRHKGVITMSHLFRIGIFGGDKRQVYLAQSLIDKGYSVITYCTEVTVTDDRGKVAYTLNELFEQCNVLIGPIPMSRDQISIFTNKNALDLTIAHVAYLLNTSHILIGGNIPAPIKDLCKAKSIPYYDLMLDNKIAVLNAIATAEGTIMEAIGASDCNLHQSNCLVLGFGRCANVLAAKLKGMDARVTIAARSDEALAYATAAGYQTTHLNHMKPILPNYDFIFNTIPSKILNADDLALVNSSVTIIDISSAPGGIDFDYARKKNINAKLCLGLPGKVAPKTSAEILSSEIQSYLKERSD